MTQAGPLIWATGAGWLVLVGSEERDRSETAELDDRLLALADFSRPVAFLPTAGGSLKEGEALLDDYADLGGPHGYVVPIYGAEDALDRENRDLLAEAGLIVLGGGDPRVLAQTLRGTPALEGMAEAFVRGAVVIGMGAGAAPLGEWVLSTEAPEEGEPAWGWLRGAVVVPHFAGAGQASELRAALRTWPGLVGIGVPERTALALGPEGQVETWGEGEVTVVVAR